MRRNGCTAPEVTNEGMNEVNRQRGILLRDKGRYDEAKTQFQQSLDASRAIGNEAQQITALIDLSYLHPYADKFQKRKTTPSRQSASRNRNNLKIWPQRAYLN
jgi:hypothetical protein